MTVPNLRLKETFSFWSHDVIRFSDTDKLGHVNNAAFAIYCETGRVTFFDQVAPGSTDGARHSFVIVRLELDFIAQAHFPGDVTIGTLVLGLGRSSCHLGQGVFTNGRCFASARSVVVFADIVESRSVPLTEPMRREMGRYLVG